MAYLLTEDFVFGFYDSCDDVQFPEANAKVIGNMCGTSAAKCTPYLLLNFLGAYSNGQSPMQINMYIGETSANPQAPALNLNFTNVNPMNLTYLRCDQSDPTACNSGTCSCQDCPSVCPAPVPPTISKACTIGPFSCPVFFSGLAIAVYFYRI